MNRIMAKPILFDSHEGDGRASRPAAPAPVADPRLTMPVPVLWHSGDPDELPQSPPSSGEISYEDLTTGEPLPPKSALWKKLRRNFLFWKELTDPAQVSVFGPPAVTPGQTVRLVVFVHPPESADGVRTLARAFQRDVEPLGTSHLVREVPREAELAVHLAVANAGVAKSLVTFPWRAQPYRLGFELHVPWESPAGLAPGLISVGRNNIRIGKASFRLHVLPRKA
jgi:hypothetical protein